MGETGLEIRAAIDFISRALNELMYYEPSRDSLKQMNSFARYLRRNKVPTYNLESISPEEVEEVGLPQVFVDTFQLYGQLIYHYTNKKYTAVEYRNFESAARIRDKINRITYERQLLLELNDLREGFNRLNRSVVVVNSLDEEAQLHINSFRITHIDHRKRKK